MPNRKLVEEGRPNTTFARATSDAFFERPENRVRVQGSQRTLIDGDYSVAKALRDFENLEALAAPNSIIASRERCDEFQDRPCGSSVVPARSLCPSTAAPRCRFLLLNPPVDVELAVGINVSKQRFSEVAAE